MNRVIIVQMVRKSRVMSEDHHSKNSKQESILKETYSIQGHSACSLRQKQIKGYLSVDCKKRKQIDNAQKLSCFIIA